MDILLSDSMRCACGFARRVVLFPLLVAVIVLSALFLPSHVAQAQSSGESTERLFGTFTYSAFAESDNLVLATDLAADQLIVLDALTLEVLVKIPAGDDPYAVGYAEESGLAFVSNEASDTVTVINLRNVRNTDLQSLDIDTREIVVGSTPQMLRVDNARGRVYVNNTQSGSITVIDAVSGEKITDVFAPNEVHHFENDMRLNAATGEVVVTAGHNDQVGVLNPDTLEISMIPLGDNGHPHSVQVDSNLNKGFATNFRRSSISVIDFDQNIQTNVIKVDPNPQFIRVNSESGKSYVFHGNSNSVTVIDNERELVIGEIELGDAGSVTGLQLDEELNLLVATLWLSDKLYVIDGKRDEVIAEFDTGISPRVPGVFDTHHRVYAANALSGTFTVVDLEKLEMVYQKDQKTKANNTFFTTPRKAAFFDGKAYITNEGDSSITVVDMHTAQIKSVFPDIGEHIRYIEVDPDEGLLYVGDMKTGEVVVVDAQSGEKVDTIKFVPGINRLKADTKNRKLYVSVTYGDAVGVIDLDTRSLVRSFESISDPEIFTLADNGDAYFFSDNKTKINRLPMNATEVQTKDIAYHHNGKIAISDDSQIVYLVGAQSASMPDGSQLTELAAEDLTTLFTQILPSDPWSVMYGEDGNVYYSSHGNHMVYRYDTELRKTEEVFDVGYEGAGIIPFGNYLYAAVARSIFRIDLRHETGLEEVSFTPRGFFGRFYVDPITQNVLMIQDFAHAVTVIDFETNKATTISADNTARELDKPSDEVIHDKEEGSQLFDTAKDLIARINIMYAGVIFLALLLLMIIVRWVKRMHRYENLHE